MAAQQQHARFDKVGRRLPDTGRGCGCNLCAEANAPRYERRSDPARDGREWTPLQRLAVRLVRACLSRVREGAATAAARAARARASLE